MRFCLICTFLALQFLSYRGLGAEGSVELSCNSFAKPNWSNQEKWIWERLCEGSIADLNKMDGKIIDPAEVQSWKENRNISKIFLDTILTDAPYRDLIDEKNVVIKGARFVAGLDLSNEIIEHDLTLENCRVDSFANFSNMKLDGHLRLVNIWSPVVWLENAKILGELELSGIFNVVDIISTLVEGQLSLDYARIQDRLNIMWLDLHKNLRMNRGTFGSVIIMHSNIASIFQSDSSTFNGNLVIDSVNFGGNVWTRNTRFEKKVIFVYSDIQKNYDISGSNFSSIVDLTGTQIGGEFRFAMGVGESGDGDQKVNWSDGAFLNLRNVSTLSLDDRSDTGVWPENLELEGFDYTGVGGFNSQGAKTLVSRDVTWLKDWLSKDKTFSHQPYQHLSGILREAGYPDKADAITMEMLNRRRDDDNTSLDTKMWLWVKWALIGYGYNSWRATVWFLILTILGMFVFKLSRFGQVSRWPTLFWYSLDMALPVIELNETHSKVRLKNGVLVYFYFHKVIGFVFVSFLIAGLSGLTK